VTRDSQRELDLGPADLSLKELDARIEALSAEVARLQDEIASLKHVKRAKMGGYAAAKRPRGRRLSDEKILAAYEANGGGRYGSLKLTAEQLGVSWKTVTRALARRKT
jgi:uncharacterized small protein (DUF1192 family)